MFISENLVNFFFLKNNFYVFRVSFFPKTVMSSKKSRLTLHYDNDLVHIRQFGTFQKKIFFLLLLVSAAGGLAVVVFFVHWFPAKLQVQRVLV